MRRTATFATLTLPTLAFAACGGEAEPQRTVACEPQGGTVAVVADDGAFRSSCVAVRAGEGFTIEFTNDDSFFHNFTVFVGGENVFVVGAAPGESATKNGGAMDAGTYEFVCTIHHGMDGTFIVK
jgi:plastocyanin